MDIPRSENEIQLNFTTTQNNHFIRFQEFKEQYATFYCSACLKLLYKDEVSFKLSSVNLSEMQCSAWGFPPIVLNPADNLNNLHAYAFCSTHAEFTCRTYVFPGNYYSTSQEPLNYRELSILSPIKIMSQMRRTQSTNKSYNGHYQVTGDIWTRHNYDFNQMLYSGTLGIPLDRGLVNIDLEKVEREYHQLCITHPLLRAYQWQQVAAEVVQTSVRLSHPFSEQLPEGWEENFVMPETDVAPNAGEGNLENLMLGVDVHNNNVQYNRPGLFALLFPYLYPECKGHYALMSNFSRELIQLDESQGGRTFANTVDGMYPPETLKGYLKHRISIADRRFGSNSTFLFFGLDTVEKHNINSANRRVVNTSGGRTFRKSDFVNNGTFIRNASTFVPHIIRSSQAYKKRQSLDLQAMFAKFGSPQIFMTLSCNDFDQNYLAACRNKRPWEDPFLFSSYFKRQFQYIFNNCILANSGLGRLVGGVKEWSWVLEIQARGSPHIHMVLWTGKTKEQLIETPNLVTTGMPSMLQDSELVNLVRIHQTHSCTDYCYKNNPEMRNCRFGYPKRPCQQTHIDAITKKVVYKRTLMDQRRTPYNPYILKLWKGNMDIQINNDDKVLHYLAKYLTKTDTVQDISVGDEQIDEDETPREHFRGRVIGSIEAVYDIMGWNKHRSSRGSVYIDTSMPGFDQKRQLKANILTSDINYNSENIFVHTHREKYENRHHQVATLNMIEYFTLYRIVNEKDGGEINNEGQEADIYAGILDPESRGRAETRTRYVESVRQRLPLECTDNFNIRYQLRRNLNRLPVWRTYKRTPRHGEMFYYQLVLLYFRSSNFDNAVGNDSWEDFFNNNIERLNLDDDYLQRIREQERSVQVERMAAAAGVNADDNLQDMLQTVGVEQRAIYNELLSPNTSGLFAITGGGGTGKSYLLRLLTLGFEERGFTVVKLAPTGVAAQSIGGETIHRFFGMSNTNTIPNEIRVHDFVREKRDIVFLIDECSMISAGLFDKFNQVLMRATENQQWMGGLTTIFFGDFAQLVPVAVKTEGLWLNHNVMNSIRFIPLTQYQRFDTGQAGFIKILNKIRILQFDEEVYDFINRHWINKQDVPNNSLFLYTTNEEVRAHTRIATRNQNFTTYRAIDTRGASETSLITLRETQLPEVIFLNIGTPVMLLHNIDVARNWVNGTVATVTEMNDDTITIQKENTEMLIVERITRHVPNSSYCRTQFPISESYAATIHKTQSLTVDRIAICMNMSFLSHGQFYVACSRVRNSDNLYFFGRKNTNLTFTKNPECADFVSGT